LYEVEPLKLTQELVRDGDWGRAEMDRREGSVRARQREENWGFSVELLCQLISNQMSGANYAMRNAAKLDNLSVPSLIGFWQGHLDLER
jgi:hypothetical protein